MRFDEYTISGTPRERGRAHGEQLAERIHETQQFYADIFPIGPREVFSRAKGFRAAIRKVWPDYGEEIEGIAKAAKIDPLWIYALNSRSELLALGATPGDNECTAIYFRPTSILGQNWDWGRRLEDLAVLMRIEHPDGHSIRMITEPGIIGKIGMNSAGIGVCLNLLYLGQSLNVGVPVHVVLRAILDARSFQDACKEVKREADGKASNILVADGNGKCVDVEFAGSRKLTYKSPGDVICHTNHYLVEEDLNDSKEDLSSSKERLEVANQRIEEIRGYGVRDMAEILSDRSNPNLPILRNFVPHDLVKDMGTVCTIIMDLAAKKLHIRKSNDPDAEFVEYAV
jgi:isopenicillin-N N-acyltransferase-like protein